ncbi:ABC-2 type transport system ATP-binding protein [Alkalibaculum bacchi]|uniref:ABC-2 type transport system ATP-binding protein n=1 Tax=Alkalibaculum bacchi TaxID=645887 RepID=A0A366HWD4_9FIRM|nr:ABC transporter ATP-binding protein [Alkalibaculum bacchi]RBP57544.1 ABC-2 type transport system ATP-binding protein [Alkalibaculum bacchi]
MDGIKIKNLNFSYGSKTVLKDLDLEISNGMFGLLGRNGAGKSTLMKLIVGLLPLKSGKISMYGNSIKNKQKIREIVGYLPQDFDFYPDMKVEEALKYLGVLDNIKTSVLNDRMDRLLVLVNLNNERKKKIKNLSGGMKRRLGIAQCLLNDPKVLVVDEPTAGLDPEERIRFRNLLSDLSEEKTVIFSTHIASDLQSSTNHLGILDNGTLVYDGTIDAILDECKSSTFETILSRQDYDKFRKEYLIFEQKETSQGIIVRFLNNGKPEDNFKRIAPTLEAAYLMKIHERRAY